MKKFMIAVSLIVCLVMLGNVLYYRAGVYIDIHPDKPITTFVKAEGDKIYLDNGDGYEEFEIKGVNMGSGEPGKWADEFDIDSETYLRWFGYIQEMGANTVRIYTVQGEDFYNAFYEYNRDNPDPLYLIHGVWVNDCIRSSHRDAYDGEFLDALIDDCKTTVDVIHGTRKLAEGSMDSAGHGNYRHDISEWVIGYTLGVEWEDTTVAYTDEKYKNDDRYDHYKGKYMYTAEGATPFEALLAQVGDKLIDYESKRYKVQKLVSFSNSPITDPFEYPSDITKYFSKCARIDAEHIKTTDSFMAGQFASYHVYPYYPDYLSYIGDLSEMGIDENPDDYYEDGKLNTYRLYLSMLTAHHSVPVVITEFGVSSGRGAAQIDKNTGRNQGNMSETEQGNALAACYNDIAEAGCAGSCVFSWQDEWSKRTWNTMHAVKLDRTPYWSDYQTCDQYFGLLAFDTGKEKSVCYVDGDISEWTDGDIVAQSGDMTLSAKYDEKFIYFLVKKDGFDLEKDVLYIPIDTTQKSGSSYDEARGLLFDRAVDFLITIDGKSDSRVQVQERYEALRSTYAENVYKFDTYAKANIPEKDSPIFKNIYLILQSEVLTDSDKAPSEAEIFETGLLTYGNADPESEDYNSLADFISDGDYVEIKIPWQLLNFADPSRMTVHDDYYDGNYGVKYIDVDKMYLGISDGNDDGRIHMSPKTLKGWGGEITYHERLKPSYYIMQRLWRQ